MTREEIQLKATEAGISLNDTELEYIYCCVRYDDVAMSCSMDYGIAEDRGNARKNLVTNQEHLLSQFIEWCGFGEPCPDCIFGCQKCDHTGRLYTDKFKAWG